MSVLWNQLLFKSLNLLSTFFFFIHIFIFMMMTVYA